MSESEVKSKQVGGDHYLSMGVQPWDVIGTWNHSEQVGFFKGNALKYLMRAGTKGDAVEDLDKAVHYIERLKQAIVEKKNAEDAGIELCKERPWGTGYFCRSCYAQISLAHGGVCSVCRLTKNGSGSEYYIKK